MKDLNLGEWKINVDDEKTKEFYASCKRQEDKISRNFRLYCDNLTSEEKEFFDSFGVDIFSCHIEMFRYELKNKEYLVCRGYFPVCVENIVYPNLLSLPMEEVIERYANGTIDDVQYRVGRFRVDLGGTERCNCFIPEGFTCFEFFCDDIKWLIDEEFEKTDYKEEQFRHYVETFMRLGIKATPIEADLIDSYRKEWVNNYAQKNKNIKKIKKLCSQYLWHIFSFGFLECDDEEIASEKYNVQEKADCVFLSNINDIGFRIENAEALTAKMLEQFIDVTVTAHDFSWTYVKTHEVDFGPYFYKKVL